MTVRNAIACVSLVFLVLASWKLSQDVSELAFVREQLQRARTTAAPEPSEETKERLQQHHRDELLAISQKEQLLHDQEAVGGTSSSLRDTIRRDVDHVAGSTAPRYNAADTAWFQFEESRVHEVRLALVFDSVAILLGLAGLIFVTRRWISEFRDSMGTAPPA